MTALATFTYTATQQVRSILIDGDPWFVAGDVAGILGYSATAALTRRLDDEDKGVRVLHTPGGEQQVTIINESGLYAAIIGSQVEGAKAFKRWLTHEVLPEIRRTGTFGGQVGIPQTMPEALRAAADAMEHAAELEALREIEAPKVEAFDALMSADGDYSMNAAAKSLGIGPNILFRTLRDRGVLMTGNTPYQRYAHWFRVRVSSYNDSQGREHATYTTLVRPAGLDGIRKLLARKDVA